MRVRADPLHAGGLLSRGCTWIAFRVARTKGGSDRARTASIRTSVGHIRPKVPFRVLCPELRSSASEPREVRAMKRVVALGIIVAALVASGAGQASAAAPPMSIDAVLTATVTRVWDANSCCVVERVLEGTATIPSLGRVDFTGAYDLITHYIFPTPQMSSHLFLTFSARNGDTFDIIGDSDFFALDAVPPTTPWAIADQTGRFTEQSGSGTYTVAGLDTDTLTFALSGDLSGP
jgi:hypothetical protein